MKRICMQLLVFAFVVAVVYEGGSGITPVKRVIKRAPTRPPAVRIVRR